MMWRFFEVVKLIVQYVHVLQNNLIRHVILSKKLTEVR
jgi:hypothetical protein